MVKNPKFVPRNICPKCGAQLKQNAFGGRKCFKKGCTFEAGPQKAPPQRGVLVNMLKKNPLKMLKRGDPHIPDDPARVYGMNPGEVDPDKLLRTIAYQDSRITNLEQQVKKLDQQILTTLIFSQAVTEALVAKKLLKEEEIQAASQELKNQADKKARGIVKPIPTKKAKPKVKVPPRGKGNEAVPMPKPPGGKITSAADVHRELAKVEARKKQFRLVKDNDGSGAGAVEGAEPKKE